MNSLKFILASCKFGQQKAGVELGNQILFNQLQKKNPHLKQNFVTNIKDQYFKDETGYKILYETSSQLLANHHKVVTIGGDHSISIGSVPAFFDVFKETGTLIWIDAHADINTNESSTTGNLHGMPLACVFDLMESCIEPIYKPTFDQLIYVGLRSIDPPEQKILNKKDILYFTSKSVEHMGMKTVSDFILKQSNKNIHISFDIDSLDPSLAPATGTPEEDGLLLDETIELLDAIHSNKNVRSVDFVEYNPYIRDDERLTLKNSTTIMESLIQ